MHSKKPLLKHLQNLVTPYYAASWKEIGLQLGIAQGILQTIEINYRTDAEKCCTEMFAKWLDTDVTASWGKLIQVVYSPAVTEMINTFNKSLYIRKGSTESGAVEELENKLKERHIITRYKSSQDDWFSMPEHFTSVALIHQKRHKTKREIIEFANMHLKGNFTESGKITTDIAEIFKSVECNDNPYTLLIEGAPGIGKTILSKEIVFQWAKESMLKNEKLVCLIYLRDPKVKMLNNFESFINYISYSQVSKDVEQYVCKKSGKGICLVFDGYDEYPEELRNSSFLADLINHEVLELQLCNIVITSRPSASACLHNIVDLRVEILGFTKEHRKSYIMHALKDNPDAIQDLLEYLESSYSVDAYCHIPLSMAILVFLFKESDYDKNQLPTTQTEINYKFICIIIRRFIKRSQQKLLSITKFSEVPATHRNILLEISKLAFIALKDDKIVLSASEIRDFCPSLLEDPKDWNGLDLLKAVQYFSLEENRDEVSFNFLHFSVQELLAAYHISLMSERQQIKLLKETFWNIRYFNVWIMYVALTKDRPFAFKHFLTGHRWRISTKLSIWWSGSANISIAKKMKEDKIKCLHLFQCFTEAGNDDMCQYVGNLLQDGTIDLSGQALSAVEMYTLSSFLARCVQRHWSLLDLSNCYLDDENFERFYKSYASLTKSTVYINTVNLSSNVFTQASASQIGNLILNFNVKNLVFAANEIEDIEIGHATFAALLEPPNSVKSRYIVIKDETQAILVRLNTSVASKLFIMFYCTIESYSDVCLYTESNSSFFNMLLNTINVPIFKAMLHNLINKMKFFSTNFKFHVETFNSTIEEVSSIINSLASSVPLAVRMGESSLPLHLYTQINDEKEKLSNSGTIFFYGNFSARTMSSTFYLALAQSNLNQIYLNGIVLYNYYFYVSPKCMSLNSLQLLNCYVHDDAVANVLQCMLIKAASLKHLNLSACRCKTRHMKIILEALKQITNISTIAISDNNLSKEVSDILSSVIACNRELQCVEVSKCNLQKSDIVSITKTLANCKDLQSLDFSNNVITDVVVANVAVVIEKCHLIKDLRLQNCQLQYAGMQKISEAMVEKTCLNYIDFSDNAITDQCAMIVANIIVNNINLRKLSFSNCKLQSTGCHQLFQAIANITGLVHLDLSKNLIIDVAVDSFVLMIHQNSGLESLNISGCFDKAKNFEKVTYSLVTLKSLCHLDLSCNVINITSADNIAIVITNNAFLEDLDLSRCEIQKFAFPTIIIALQKIHHLKYLYLNANTIVYEEATGIATVVSKNPFLEKVDLSNCNLTEEEMKAFLLSLKSHNSLKHFDISSNTITNHVVNDIVDVIDSSTQLTYLNISDTDIQEYGILKIFKAVQRINTLKCIKLCNCTISDRAAKDIADAISVNCMMEELVFTNNDFCEGGITLIFDVLEKIHTLKCLTIASNYVIHTKSITIQVTEVVSSNHITYLDLSNCDLQKSSCSPILNALTVQAPNLQHIDLSGNNLSDTAENMAQLISISYYLQSLSLANTLMRDKEVMIIIKSMQNITSLHYVDLTSYSINDQLKVELQSTIHKNPSIISFKLSRLCYQKFDAAVTTLGKTFTVVHNLQQIAICFTEYEVDAVATLINNSPCLQYLHLENYSMLDINISNIIVALSRITTLEYFCLVNIAITDQVDDGITAVIENNTQLKYFKLVACEVTENELTKYIQSFNIAQLSHLVLSKMDNVISHNTNQLKRPICDSLTHLNLSDVHLDVTKLSLLSLTSLTKLKYLNLSHNPLTDESADILSSVIFNNNTLKHLYLCDCKLKSEGIRVIANSLPTMSIVCLDMSLNTIDIDTFNNDVMPALLPSLNIIEHLYFPCCELKQNINEIDGIQDFISNALHLNFIDFGQNTIPRNMINDFKNIIFVSKGNKQICFSTEGIKKVNVNTHETENLYHSLHYLNINNITVDDEVGNTVATLIANSPELEHLEMFGGKWDITSGIKCFKALQNNSHLVYLNFSVDHSYLALSEVFYLLSRCTSLKVLELHNCCTSKDTITVTTASPKFFCLNYLDLGNNFIDDQAVDYLSVLITTNVGLEYLSFCNCKLSSSGIQSISSALRIAPSLKFLDFNLSHTEGINLIEDQIATWLANNMLLQELRLSNLVLDNNTFHQIQSRHLVIKKLQRLTINNCIFTDEDTSTIISLIVNNSALCELTLLNCQMSVKCKIKFTCIATAMYLQCLKFNITVKHSLNTPLHCNVSKFTLTDNDVVAVMTVDNYLGEFIMFKLMLNRDNLYVLSTNGVTIRYLKTLHIQDCNFTDYYAHYVAFLITNNATTIQSLTLTSCKMSIKQKMILTKALYKLDVLLLQHLNICNFPYADDEITKNFNYNFSKTNCRLTAVIMISVMTDHVNLRISRLVLNQTTLAELKNLKSIKGVIHLKINDCIFDIETDNSVANIIANSAGLSHLTMSQCEITESGLVRVMHSIVKGLRNLLYINFSHLKFSCKVISNIISVINCNTKLRHINLCNCQLLTRDINLIIQAAKMLTTLEYFDLSCNQVTSHLANDIKTLIANNRNIEVLSFPNYTFLMNNNHLKVVLNTVTDLLLNDVATIIMTTSKVVTEISLLNCSLNNDQLKVVLNAVNHSSSLPYVDFIINEINNKSITNVKDVIKNNSRIKEFTKVLKLLVIESLIMHKNFDLAKFIEIHHVGIIGCTVNFKECNILKQLVYYNALLNTLVLSDCQIYNEISEIVEICTCLNFFDMTNVTIERSDNLKYSSIKHSGRNNLKTFSISCMNFTGQTIVDILNIVYKSKNLNKFSMVKCNIDGCEDNDLWKVFLECENLEHLDLSYSKMSDKIAAFIIANSTGLSCIKMVSCDYNTKEFLSICNALQKHFYIVQLNVNNNEIVCNYAVEIADIIRNNKYLVQIEMAACNFDKVGIVQICQSIGLCSRFQHINFSCNKKISCTVGAVVSMLSESKNMEYINLQCCGLTCAGSRDVMMALAVLSSLKFVDLSLNEMTEDSVVHVAEMITKNKYMEVLCLPDFKFTTVSGSIKLPSYSLTNYMVIQFLWAIRDSRSFKRVEFGCIQINDDLASEVAALIARNIGLIQLKFSELILTNSGFRQLGNSILIMEGLNSISITGVHFTYSESCHLATLINNNKSVKSFDISNSVISDKAKNIIFEAMINLTSLMSLNLKNIVISDTLEDKVLVVITNNTSLEYLEVTGCEINIAKLREVTSSFNYLKVVSE